MSACPTMRVTNDDGVEMVINAADFDASVHTPVEGEDIPTDSDSYAGVAVTGDDAVAAKKQPARKRPATRKRK